MMMPCFDGVNRNAYRLSLSMYPDFKRALGAARPELDAAILDDRQQIRGVCRVLARVFWWRVMRVIAPYILQIVVEFLMERKGFLKSDQCSKPVRAALSGDGLEAWHRP